MTPDFASTVADVNHAPDPRANLQRLLAPASIAVVGVSEDPAKAGSQALRTLATFPGRRYAIHPRAAQIQGVTCFRSLGELPEPVDLVILAVPAPSCPELARQAAAAGVGALLVISGGFAESGAAGAALEQELAAICQQSGMRLLGPNTSGFINPQAGCVANFVPGVERLQPGRVAVLAQSGGINLSLAFLLEHMGCGLSLAAGLGNAANVGTCDVLEWLLDDPHTDAIALHLEGIEDGRQLYECLRRITPRKPVVALVAGRAEIGDFAVSHTGKLMGSRQRSVAALRQAGAVVVETTQVLASTAALLARQRLPAKECSGFALVTGQAGPGLLIVDALKHAGLAVPELTPERRANIESLLPALTYVRNPVDTGRPGPSFPAVLEQVALDTGVDAVLVFGLHEPSVLEPLAALQPARQASGKPILFGSLGLAADMAAQSQRLAAAGELLWQGPEALAQAAIALDDDARGQWQLKSEPMTWSPAQARLHGPYDEQGAKQLLSRYGIRSPQSVLCHSNEEAQQAFQRLAKPVVVKIAAEDVAHKTEAGGVFLDVRTASQLQQAWDAIARIPTRTPGKVLVEEMVGAAGVELIVGAVRDPSWGPCIMLGLGGVQAEALEDSSVKLVPLSAAAAAAMPQELRGQALLNGFRGLPVCDRETVVQVLQALSRLMQEHPEIAEVEINPLRVFASGALALDALVVLDAAK